MTKRKTRRITLDEVEVGRLMKVISHAPVGVCDDEDFALIKKLSDFRRGEK